MPITFSNGLNSRPDYVTREEFGEFKERVSDGFDAMEELIVNTKIEVIGTLTDVIDTKIHAFEKRLSNLFTHLIDSKIDSSEKRLSDLIDSKIGSSEGRIMKALVKIEKNLSTKFDGEKKDRLKREAR